MEKNTTMSQETRASSPAASDSTGSGKFKVRNITFGHFAKLLGGLVAIAGLIFGALNYAGITHLPIITHVLHPGAERILASAQATTFRDMSCTEHDSYLGTPAQGSGVCTFMSNPERTEFRFDFTNPPADSIYLLFDASSNTIYSKSPNQSKWSKSQPDCPNGLACPPAFLQSLTSLYNVTKPQFVGVDAIRDSETYHIQGELQSPVLSSSAVEELWFRQDDYYPVRLVLHDVKIAHTAIPLITYTLDFTGYNQGPTIALPSSDQIQQ
jgi:hypothetical protein